MIEVEHVCKSFGDKAALDNLSFSIAAGEVYGLLGPNGSGKTTTINILCNLLDPDSGSVRVSGRPVTGCTKYSVGVAPQDVSVYRDLTCRENLNFFASLFGLSKKRRAASVETLVQDFHLNEYLDTPVSRLSGGWQRRVNIAAALVHCPSILILDEPTSALDVEARHAVWELIAGLNRRGVTVLLTTHYLEEVEKLCSRIGIMQHGRVLTEGTLDELLALVPAAQLALVETDDRDAVVGQAVSMGWQYRDHGGRLTIWLPRVFTLKEFVDAFSEAPLLSVSLQPVGLEEVYIEVVHQ